VTEWNIGDRVGICPTTEAGTPGYVRDGGFSDKIVTPVVSLVRIPDNLSVALGAVGSDAGMTSQITNGQVKAAPPPPSASCGTARRKRRSVRARRPSQRARKALLLSCLPRLDGKIGSGQAVLASRRDA